MERRAARSMAAEAGARAAAPARRVEPGAAGLGLLRRGACCRSRLARRTCGCCRCSAAGLLFSILPVANAAAVRAASVVVFLIAATLWLPNTVDLLRFIVAIFGRLPIVTPVFVYAAVMAAAGLMLAPPLVAAIAQDRPLRVPSLATAALPRWPWRRPPAFAYLAPAYTDERTAATGRARGAGRRRSSRLGRGIGRAGRRSRRRRALGMDAGGGRAGGSACRVRRLPHPFVFRSSRAEPRPRADRHRRAHRRTGGGRHRARGHGHAAPSGPGGVVRPSRRARARHGRTSRARCGSADGRRPTWRRRRRASSSAPASADRRRRACAASASSPPRSAPGDGSGWQPPAWLPQCADGLDGRGRLDRGAASTCRLRPCRRYVRLRNRYGLRRNRRER